MNNSELITVIAAKSGVSKTDVTTVISEFQGVIKDMVLTNGHTVALDGFGTFKQAERSERTGKSHITGEAWHTGAKTILGFKPAKDSKIEKEVPAATATEAVEA